jgi:hypothetical protein
MLIRAAYLGHAPASDISLLLTGAVVYAAAAVVILALVAGRRDRRPDHRRLRPRPQAGSRP